MSGTDTITPQEVYAKLETISDPEIGAPVTEIDLIDSIEVNDRVVYIKFHPTIPYCPPIWAIKIAADIVDAVGSIEGVDFVDLMVSKHYLADEINRALASRKLASDKA